jgi:hypothetical protein
MRPDQITADSLPLVIRDPMGRAKLLESMGAEQGTHLPLSNRVAEIAPHCSATSRELDELVEILLANDPQDGILGELAFHPNMSTPTLLRLLDLRRAMNALLHRASPEDLLLKVAEKEPCQEATLTLALCIYGPDPNAETKFFWFLRKNLHCHWPRESLRLSAHAHRMPGERRANALRLVDEYEAEHPDDRTDR